MDPDIGLCDDCGSDEGRRIPIPRSVVLMGERKTIAVWLCTECRRLLRLV